MGTVIGIFGRTNPDQEIKGIKLIWHHGDKVDAGVEKTARTADILVVITRFASHEVMWWLKETAVDFEKLLIFVRETNPERILQKIAEQRPYKISVGGVKG